MRSIVSGRTLRMIRLRRRWRQADVAVRAGLSPATIGRHENGRIASLPALEKHAAALDVRAELKLIGRGGDLARLGDEEHAAIVEVLTAWFRAAGFLTEVEASFNEFGDRGRVDLLACDPRSGSLVIVEVKTLVAELHDLLGAINIKERVASRIADHRGWQIHRRVTVLAVADTYANRAMVRDHASTFADWSHRRIGVDTLRDGPARIIHWVSAGRAARASWIGSRQRMHKGATGAAVGTLT